MFLSSEYLSQPLFFCSSVMCTEKWVHFRLYCQIRLWYSKYGLHCVYMCMMFPYAFVCQGALWRSWGAGVLILSGCQGQQLLLIIEAEGGICPKRTWGTPILSLFLSSVFCRTHINILMCCHLHGAAPFLSEEQLRVLFINEGWYYSKDHFLDLLIY